MALATEECIECQDKVEVDDYHMDTSMCERCDKEWLEVSGQEPREE